MKKKQKNSKQTIDLNLSIPPTNSPIKIEQELNKKEISLNEKDKKIFLQGVIFSIIIFLLTIIVVFIYYLKL